MNPKLKSFLIVSVKQAVNAVLTNAGLSALFHQTFNFKDWQHIANFGKAALAVVAAREVLVWAPKILAWTQTPTPGE